MKIYSKILFIVLLSVSFSTLISCDQLKKKKKKTEKAKVVQTEVQNKVEFMLSPASNSNVSGHVLFTEENGEVSLVAHVEGLSKGMHAIHIHESADCTDPSGKSAGGHWNPLFQPHGKWGSPEGYHRGDIGNFEVGEDGKATITFNTNEWCIDCEDDTKNIVGKALIIHQGEDDLTSQPSGAAGARIACSGIIS